MERTYSSHSGDQNGDRQNLAAEDAENDLKMIVRSLEAVEDRIDRLTEKRKELKLAKEKIESILSGKYQDTPNPVRQKRVEYDDERDEDYTDEQTEKLYSLKTGRRFFTDAFKNYTIRLSQKYSFKAVAESTGVLYNNIVRWKMEKLRGQIAPDETYQPNEQELREEARLEAEFGKRKSFFSPTSSQLDSSGDDRYYPSHDSRSREATRVPAQVYIPKSSVKTEFKELQYNSSNINNPSRNSQASRLF